MNLTFTHRTIAVENLDSILNELSICVENIRTKYETSTAPFHHVPVHEVLLQCLNFRSWCRSKGIMPSAAAVIRVWSSPVPKPHIDYTRSNLALNFGLRIPQGSYTAIYDSDIQGTNEITSLGAGYISLPAEHCREVDRFDLKEPTVFNIQRPHSVVTPLNTERLSISFRFAKDPWHLVS